MNKWRARGARVLACAIGCLLLMAAGGQSALALEQPTANPVPGQTTTYDTVATPFSLTISPTRLVVGAEDAGQSQSVLAVNRGDQPVTVEVKTESFVGKQDGSLDFTAAAPYSAIDWVTISPASFTLAPGLAQKVVVTVAKPASPEPGDHQVAIVFLVPAGKTSSNISINRGIATPVYIAVPGVTDNTTRLRSFTAPSFSGGGPIDIRATVYNSGNAHRDFRATTAIAITGAGATLFPDFTVVRESLRDVSVAWTPPVMCVCTLSVAIPNATGGSSARSVTVVVFPVLWASILLGLVLLALVTRYLRRRRASARRVPTHLGESSAS